MLSVDEGIAPTLPFPAAVKRKKMQSNAMKRTSEWLFSQELPTDITVQVGDAAFSLHKFPLLSKCGYIRKLLAEADDSSSSAIQILDFPGGPEAFELAAKFCYGINFDLSIENIAMLRCAAEYLGMTEDYSIGNLVSRAEEFLEEVALVSLSSAVTVLHKSEDLLPVSEKAKLVSRCIDAIASLACNGNGQDSMNSMSSTQPRAFVNWWAEELMILKIDTFRWILMAMEARGMKKYTLGPVIMLYAQKSLRALDMFGGGRKMDPKQEHEKRVVLETIVSLLPRERNAMSVSFLSMLLRAALYLDTTVACRLELEKRIALQLEQAVLDDLLIPSFSFNGNTIYDVDTVQRILMNYLDNEFDGSHSDDEYVSPPPNSMDRVGKFMENYLSEIASDQSLTISSFVSLAELVPEQARITEDGIYRAIDIYLKAHPCLSDIERKTVCGLMDCQNLSREACAHAAQNDRLPVQVVAQVLYYEQQRLRDTETGSFIGGESPALSIKTASYSNGYQSQMEEVSRLQRENNDLKFELVKTRMQLKQLQKPTEQKPAEQKPTETFSEKPPLPKKSIINSVSKKLGRLNPFVRADGISVFSGKARTKPPKNRRHSIS